MPMTVTDAALAAQPASSEAPSSTANPPSSRPSFASLFSGSAPLENFNVQAKICSKDGFPAVNFDHNDLARAANVFRLSLVMKFPYFQRPPVETLRSIVNTKWGLKSEVKLSLLDNRHALMRFTQDADMLKVLSRDSSRIDGVLYKIFKWSPDFDPSIEGSKTQIWVQLKGLPLHLYFPSMLRQISKPIGDFLRADNSTLTLSNTQRARFCIEVNLLKPLPEKIWINYNKNSGKYQEVTYEMIPNYCKHCSIQGHMESSCWKKNPTLKKPCQKEVVPQPHQKQWKINGNQTEETEFVRMQGNGRQTENDGKELEENEDADQVFDEMPSTKNCQKVTQGIEVMREEPLSTSNTFEALQVAEVHEDEEIVEAGDLVDTSQTLGDHQKRDVHETDIVPETLENLVNSKEDQGVVFESSVGLEEQNDDVQPAEIESTPLVLKDAVVLNDVAKVVALKVLEEGELRDEVVVDSLTDVGTLLGLPVALQEIEEIVTESQIVPETLDNKVNIEAGMLEDREDSLEVQVEEEEGSPPTITKPNTRFKGSKTPCTFVRKKSNIKKKQVELDEIANIPVPDGTPLQQVRVTQEALFIMAQLDGKGKLG